MSNGEKVVWLQVLLGLWAIAFILILMPVSFSDHPDLTYYGQGVAIIIRIAGLITVGYLAVLSWRVAYIAGRKSA